MAMLVSVCLGILLVDYVAPRLHLWVDQMDMAFLCKQFAFAACLVDISYGACSVVKQWVCMASSSI